MPLPAYALPFGLRDVKLWPLSADGITPGTMVDLPIGRTFSFADTEDFEELRGDDQKQANHGSGTVVNWDLEGGGISLEAYAIIAGGVVTSAGVTPNVIKTYDKKTTDARPEFRVEGQAISDNGGDFHCRVWRCKATDDIEGEMADGAFWLTSASGEGLGSKEATHTDKAYYFKHNETAAAIV